jgi:hypothetical protein
VHGVRRFLSDAHPALDVRLVSGHTSEHVHGLMQGQLQAGLVILPPTESRVTFESFHTDNLMLALAKTHNLTSKKHIEITDLHHLPLVTMRGDIEPRFGRSLKLLFDLIRVRPQFFHDTTNQTEALEIVAQEGVAALTTPAAQHPTNDRVVFRKFNNEILYLNTGLAYFGEPVSPILKSLREFLSGAFKPLASSWDKEQLAGQIALF